MTPRLTRLAPCDWAALFMLTPAPVYRSAFRSSVVARAPSAERQMSEASTTTYVSLINWTEWGIKDFRDTTQRAEDFSRHVESSGGMVRELLWTSASTTSWPSRTSQMTRLPSLRFCESAQQATSAATPFVPSTLRRWQASSGALSNRP